MENHRGASTNEGATRDGVTDHTEVVERTPSGERTDEYPDDWFDIEKNRYPVDVDFDEPLDDK